MGMEQRCGDRVLSELKGIQSSQIVRPDIHFFLREDSVVDISLPVSLLLSFMHGVKLSSSTQLSLEAWL